MDTDPSRPAWTRPAFWSAVAALFMAVWSVFAWIKPGMAATPPLVTTGCLLHADGVPATDVVLVTADGRELAPDRLGRVDLAGLDGETVSIRDVDTLRELTRTRIHLRPREALTITVPR